MGWGSLGSFGGHDRHGTMIHAVCLETHWFPSLQLFPSALPPPEPRALVFSFEVEPKRCAPERTISERLARQRIRTKPRALEEQRVRGPATALAGVHGWSGERLTLTLGLQSEHRGVRSRLVSVRSSLIIISASPKRDSPRPAPAIGTSRSAARRRRPHKKLPRLRRTAKLNSVIGQPEFQTGVPMTSAPQHRNASAARRGVSVQQCPTVPSHVRDASDAGHMTSSLVAGSPVPSRQQDRGHRGRD